MLSFINTIWQQPNIKAAVISAIISVLLEVSRRIIVPKARIVFGISFDHFFIIPQENGQNLNIRVRRIVISNIGRAPADQLELILNFKPEHYDVWPPIVDQTVDGRFLKMTATSLGRGELLQVNMMDSRGELPMVVSCRSSGGTARLIPLVPQVLYSKTILRLVALAMIVGVLAIIFITVRLILLVGSS